MQDTWVAPAAPVSVHYSPPTISIRVTEAVPLEVVLGVLCAELDARCDPVPALLSRPMISPKSISGSWESVIEELVAEVGIGYAAVPPGEGRRAQLLLQGSTPPPDEPSRRPESSSPGAASEELSSSTERAETPEPTAPEEVESTTTAEPEAGEKAGTSGGEASPRSARPIPVVLASAPAPATPLPLVPTPFAAPEGGPLAVPVVPNGAEAAPGWVATPFSNEDGSPLTLPFIPDNSPVAPFSDPHGQPIPIEVGTKLPKLKYPIPPTPLIPPPAERQGDSPHMDTSATTSSPPSTP